MTSHKVLKKVILKAELLVTPAAAPNNIIINRVVCAGVTNNSGPLLKINKDRSVQKKSNMMHMSVSRKKTSTCQKCPRQEIDKDVGQLSVYFFIGISRTFFCM
jgi:hypothetical protein